MLKPLLCSSSTQARSAFVETRIGRGLSLLTNANSDHRVLLWHCPSEYTRSRGRHRARVLRPHLMCYQAVKKAGQPKHKPVVGIFVNNQFGPEQLDTTTEEELCVPSSKIE